MDIKSSISKREKFLIIATVLVVGLGIAYIFLIEPLYKKFLRLNQEIDTKKLQLIKSQKLMREKDNISQNFKKYAHKLKAKSSNEEEMAAVLSEIENLSKTSGIYLSDVKPQKIKDMDFYKVLLVEIKFQATMQTLSKFLYELKNSPSLLKVKRLQINIKGAESSLLEGILQINKVSLS